MRKHGEKGPFGRIPSNCAPARAITHFSILVDMHRSRDVFTLMEKPNIHEILTFKLELTMKVKVNHAQQQYWS